MDLNILVMAAGLGTRMKSRKAKVLHKLVGQPLINHVYQTALSLSPKRILMIIGHQADDVAETLRTCHQQLTKLSDSTLVAPEHVLQLEQRGTGHAVMMAKEQLAKDDTPILVLSGDVPLISAQTLKNLFEVHKSNNAKASVLTTTIADPTGYGRIIRTDKDFDYIVEHRDANPTELAINEINAGIYCFESKSLFNALEQISPNNSQGEYYLTDVLSVLKKQGDNVAIYQYPVANEVLGINNRLELAEAEKRLRKNKLTNLMLSGVTIIDPDSIFIDPQVTIGMDSIIYPNVIIEGYTTVGENCTLYPGVHLVNAQLANGVTVKDYSLVVDSFLADETTVGPFAHLRMGAKLEANATVGNFVEVKKSTLGRKTKAMHLAYLGDATIGNQVNIGAGTITCNYDGKNKHSTIIADNVKIGSDTMLVAPVTVGEGSITGAGTVLTKDVPANSLAVGVPAVIKKQLTKA
jgi:bifunctional UDP-N-acetylglucosamine pyrophosphorylase / glucosamine-1-phosphate N-acetyltransferase